MSTTRLRSLLLLTTLLPACSGRIEEPGGSRPAPVRPEVVQAEKFPGLPDIPPYEEPKVPHGLLETLKDAKEKIGNLASIFGYVGTAKEVLTMLGFFDDTHALLSADLRNLHQQIEEWHIADEARDLIDQRNDRIIAMEAATDKVHAVFTAWPDIDWRNLTPAQAASLSDADTLSDEAANSAGKMSAFLRKYRPSLTDGEWKRFMHVDEQQPPLISGLVYDWRLGIAELTRLTAQRLLIIGLEDPDFVLRRTRTPELQRMHAALSEHYRTMLEGIHCARDLGGDITVVCADVYSGTSAIAAFPSTGCYLMGSSNPLTPTCQAKVDLEILRLRQTVRDRLPLFQLRALIDSLELMLAPIDPIQNLQIRLADGPNHWQVLCLSEKEVFFDEDQSYFAAIVDECAGRAEQLWAYDPVTSTIWDGAGRCLTTAPLRRFGTFPGVGLADCDGGDAQKWTYDRSSNHFSSGVNTVLAIPGDGWVSPGTFVVTVEVAPYPVADPAQTWSLQEWTRNGSGGRPGSGLGL
jgi:hypothetical protein